jgi:hypothetical protein
MKTIGSKTLIQWRRCMATNIHLDHLTISYSRELTTRKITRKTTKNTCFYSATHTRVHSSCLKTRFFILHLQNAPKMAHHAPTFSYPYCFSSGVFIFFSLLVVHAKPAYENCLVVNIEPCCQPLELWIHMNKI